MNEQYERFVELKEFIGFGAEDVANLRSLAPLFAEHGPAVTDEFYRRLGEKPDTAAVIAGRVDRLKQTHQQWMKGLFAGEYERPYFEERWRIGMAHVRAGIPPLWVEMVMSFLRDTGLGLIGAHMGGPEGVARSQSLLKILDIDLWIINLAYGDERLARLSAFTGMSRKLIDRCVIQGR
ncbi:MAG TPA: protoglobin domain-containing protein [Nannocystis sp.]